MVRASKLRRGNPANRIEAPAGCITNRKEPVCADAGIEQQPGNNSTARGIRDQQHASFMPWDDLATIEKHVKACDVLREFKSLIFKEHIEDRGLFEWEINAFPWPCIPSLPLRD